MGGRGPDSSGSGWGPAVGCYEHGNEDLGFMECSTFLNS
jgi:hypothetical protein